MAAMPDGIAIACQRGGGVVARLLATGLRCGLGHTGLGRGTVPATGRGCDIDGIVRLRLGGKGLDRELCGGERLRVEAFCDIVALAGGVGVALRCGEAEPLEGFGEVLFDADTAGIEDAEIVLAVGHAPVGRLAEPLGGSLVVGAFAAAIGFEHGEVMHRLGIAAVGSLQVVAPRDVDVLLHAQALLVEGAEPEDGGHHAGMRGAVVPFRGFVEIASRPCLRQSARRPHRPRSHRPSALRCAIPVHRFRPAAARSAAPVPGRSCRPAVRRSGNSAGDVVGAGQCGGCGIANCGIATAQRHPACSAPELFDWRPIGVGEIIEGCRGRRAGCAGAAPALGRSVVAGSSMRRHRRRAAGVEQVHRHLEGAEHDHDHARADQQRANLGGDARGFACRRPCPCLGGALALAFAAALAAARAVLSFGGCGGGGLRGAARGGDEARCADRLLRCAA